MMKLLTTTRQRRPKVSLLIVVIIFITFLVGIVHDFFWTTSYNRQQQQKSSWQGQTSNTTIVATNVSMITYNSESNGNTTTATTNVSIAKKHASTTTTETIKKQQRSTSSIRSGEIWYDTNGNPINAHGGGFLHYNGTYYWYGEMKMGTTAVKKQGKARVQITGISCYSSIDLVNWNYHGIALKAASQDNPKHDLHPSKVAERPKVVYNHKTNQFVMWLHVDTKDYKLARCGVAISDTPYGPFEYLKSFRLNAKSWPMDYNSIVHRQDRDSTTIRNNMTEEKRQRIMPKVVEEYDTGQMARDFTIFIDPDDDYKGYVFSSSEGNPTMHISELTEDYLDVTGVWTRVFIKRSMEAPTIFKHLGRYYFIASGCTGWLPNAARLAVSYSGSMWGPWIEKGNPAIGDDNSRRVGEKVNKTFRSQPTYVLPIYDSSENINELVDEDNHHQQPQRHFIYIGDRWERKNLANSRYVWLPIVFNENNDNLPEIHWLDEWSPFDYFALSSSSSS